MSEPISNESETRGGSCAPAPCSASGLQDTDPMPFGKYKGTPMQDVPASYLHWLWTKGLSTQKIKPEPVGEYIRRNLSALRMEHKDGIW